MIIKSIFVFLAVFEFFMVFRMLVQNDWDNFSKEFILYPSELFENEAAKYFIASWTFFLGLLRMGCK